jgi:hypothetical protein
MIPPIADEARKGFSRDQSSHQVAEQYWAQLFAPTIVAKKLVAPWLKGGPIPADLSGSSIFSAVSLPDSRGLIVDQVDPDQRGDELGWFFNTWDPDQEDILVLKLRCVLGPKAAETATALARRWFVDTVPKSKLIEEFRTSHLGP